MHNSWSAKVDLNTWESATVEELFYVKGRIGWRGLRRSQFTDHGPYLITGMHINEGKVQWDDCFHISEDKFQESPEIIVEVGDIIITKDGTIGKVAYIDYLPGPTSLNSHLFLVRPKVNRVDRRFAYHVFTSGLFNQHINDHRTGSTISGLSEKLFLRFSLPLPLTQEQRLIADILDIIDTQIQYTEQLITKLNLQKIGLLEDLLTCGLDEHGQLRDPAIYLEDFKDTRQGKLPKGWISGPLKDFYAIPARNGLYKPSQYYGKGTLMIHMPQMFRGLTIDPTDAARVKITISELERFQLKVGDLLFARRSLNFDGAGRCSLISELSEPATFESSIIRVRLSIDKIRPEFVNYFLNSNIGYRLRTPLIRQVAVAGVSSGDIANIPIPCPPLKEQDAIIEAMHLFDTNIHTEKLALDKLKLYKKGLMHNLLAGNTY